MNLINNCLTILIVVIVSENVFSKDVKSCYVCQGTKCSDEYTPPKEHKTNCSGITIPPFPQSSQSNSLIVNQILEGLKPRSINDIKFGEIGCGKLSITHPLLNDTVLYIRGCMVQTVMDMDACDYLEHVVGTVLGEVDGCHMCDEDNCNSANSYQISFILLASLIVALTKIFY